MPVLRDIPPTDQRVIDLMNAQQRELRALYNDTDERTEPFDRAILSGEGFVLLAVEEDGALLACGALKSTEPQAAEVKRMDTLPGARGHGLGRHSSRR